MIDNTFVVIAFAIPTSVLAFKRTEFLFFASRVRFLVYEQMSCNKVGRLPLPYFFFGKDNIKKSACQYFLLFFYNFLFN